ncbi:hypothetical protein V5O48_001840 [Marasmius crinis-equi]|uniref:Uncharacterized protein n=1 Tax=Marasmius crinis-equi TaxID=585013 RepID=A0ABR3FXA9_9AGAR
MFAVSQLPSSDGFAAIILGLVSLQALFLGLQNVASLTELLLPDKAISSSDTSSQRRSTPSESDAAQSTPSDTATSVICGAFGSIIFYFGEILQSGSGSTTLLFLTAATLLTCCVSFWAEKPRASTTKTSGASTELNGSKHHLGKLRDRIVASRSYLATFFAFPRALPSATVTVTEVSPGALYLFYLAMMITATKITTDLGLCSAFEAHGACRQKFQANLWDVIFYHFVLMKVAMWQDLLLGISIAPIPDRFACILHRFQRPYAFVLLPSFIRLHYTFVWRKMIPLLTEGVDGMLSMLVSALWGGSAAALEQLADSIVNVNLSSRFAGLLTTATVLTFAPAVTGGNKGYWLVAIPAMTLLIAPWETIKQSVSSVIAFGFAILLFTHVFQRIADCSPFVVVGLALLSQALLVLWSFVIHHSVEARVSYAEAECWIVQNAIATVSATTSGARKGSYMHAARVIVDLASLGLLVGVLILTQRAIFIRRWAIPGLLFLQFGLSLGAMSVLAIAIVVQSYYHHLGGILTQDLEIRHPLA